MNKTLCACMSLTALALSWRADAIEPARAAESGCTPRAADDPTLDELLKSVAIKSGDQTRRLGQIRFSGLAHIKEKELWTMLGGRPEAPDVHRAAVILRWVAGLGVFSKVVPVLHVAGERLTLEIQVIEHPFVQRVVFEGLDELKPEELLEQLFFEAQSLDGVASDDEPKVDAKADAKADVKADPDPDPDPDPGKHAEADEKKSAAAETCPEPGPAESWLARTHQGDFRPGVVWNGLKKGMDSVLHTAFDRGYQMVTVNADLARDGTLTLHVDEGRLEGVVIRGVASGLEADVRQRLDLPVGGKFVSGELDAALARVRAAYPFLDADRATRGSRPEPKMVEEAGADGTRQYRTVETAPPQPATMHEGVELRPGRGRERPFDRTARMQRQAEVFAGRLAERVDRIVERGEDDEGDRWYAVEGHTVVVYLRARRGDVNANWVEILRHTPVTGFAPGLELLGHLWDPADRAHLAVDLAGNVNTHRARQPLVVGGPPAEALERWRFDGLVGGRVQIPALRVAEVGVQRYTRVDTADRWRIDRIDSYVYSALFNRPESEYFHRSGLAAFITMHLFDRLTAGVEYRRDRYHSLTSIDRYFTLFYKKEPARTTPGITEGKMGSLLLRAEWSMTPRPAYKVGGPLRDAERSIVRRDYGDEADGPRTVNTLEIVDPSLGGDAVFKFVRLVSDTTEQIRLWGDHRLLVRLRVAGALSGTLPIQKEEALGGWIALRGYDFKEVRGGNFSVLGTVEYREGPFSVFLDTGSVRTGSSFGPDLNSLGVALNLGDEAHLDFAWRLDDRARVLPLVRFFFQRTF
jgi:hypothetical protein